MDIKAFLQGVKDGSIPFEQAEQMLLKMPYEDLGFAKLDHHRGLRGGFNEVIFGQGKTPEQLGTIFAHFASQDKCVLATRCTLAHYEQVQNVCPDAKFDPVSKTIVLSTTQPDTGCIAVCTAGTSDMPVAEEAAQTAEFFGSRVCRFYDVGVAGIHRLFSKLEDIRKANCIIAVAGMEGALPGVLAGLVDKPVIALPTSVGYGANFGGLSALLTMLNSCAEGIGVVNIDNGFGAGYLATQINRLAEGKR